MQLFAQADHSASAAADLCRQNIVGKLRLVFGGQLFQQSPLRNLPLDPLAVGLQLQSQGN